jgi:P4 family phage/plasmid primase-like protien
MTLETDAAAAVECDLRIALASGLDHNFASWLRFVGWRPGTWLELQALGVPGRYGDRVCFAHANSVADATALLTRGERLNASGLYTIANTINPAVATRATPRQWHDAKKGSSTSDRDIIHRRVVFIDVDCKRPSGTSATDAELARTIPVAAAVRAWFAARVGDGPLGSGASGNGRQLFIAFEETAESPELATLVRELVGAVAKRFSAPESPVDGGVVDAKRLVPAFGTTKRKGAPGIAERPHRLTAFVCAQEVSRVSVETLEKLLAELRSELGEAAKRPAGTRVEPSDDGEDDEAWDVRLPRPKEDRFALANATPFDAVAEALGLLVDGLLTCPGCKNTGGVAAVGNGLKCHHQSCASKGVPGRPGFRTVVDVVAEAQSLSPSEAVDWVLVRFGVPSPTTDPEPREPADVAELKTSLAGQRFPLTDIGNAERFAAHHGVDLRHCHEWKKWLAWSDARWANDRRGEVDLRAIQTVRAIKAEARQIVKEKVSKAVLAHAQDSERATALSAMTRIARALPGVPVVPEQLDRDPFLFNCLNGTLDLRTGELREHRREDYLTKLAPVVYDPNAKAPLWEKFLLEIMGDDVELVAFLQRAIGYSMTGCVNEQALFFCYGDGANGKSTFLRAVLEVFGDYGMPGAPDILVAKRQETHPAEVADLFGARLVVCQELEAGRALAESTMKKLTGSDPIKARLMHENFWTFLPTHKFWLAANHKPRVSGTDEAVWRRLKLIPFLVTIPEGRRDGQLLEKLLVERSGILRWAVEGCSQWRAGGLKPPAQVVKATREYREEEDRLAAFLEECCEFDPSFVISSVDLYRSYAQWCDVNAARPLARRAFGEGLKSHHCTADRGTGGVRQWVGLRVNGEHAPVPSRGGGRDGGRQGGMDWTDA